MSAPVLRSTAAARTGREGAAPSRPLPVVTAALCLAALGVHALGLGDALQYERGAIAAGQIWRLFTGHLAHWSADHLVWDVAALALLGGLVERRGRGRYAGLLIAGGGAISLGLLVVDPGLAAYRGLSGLDAMLFVALALDLVRDAVRSRDACGVAGGALLLAGLAAKILAEQLAGASVFVAQVGAVEVAPLAHAIGAAWATAVVAARATRSASVAASRAAGSPAARRRDRR